MSVGGQRDAESIAEGPVDMRFIGCFAQFSASVHTPGLRAGACRWFADAQPLRGVTITRQAYGSPLHLLG